MFSWQRDILVTALCHAGLPRLNASPIDSLALVLASRAVIKCGGPGAGGPPGDGDLGGGGGGGVPPGYIEFAPPPPHPPTQISEENRRKIEPKEIPSCLIPHLLVVFTWQLEILVTVLSGTSEAHLV